MATSTYSAPVAAPVTKIGAHHLAYLRALAEGVAQHQAAARYLGHDMADGATALRQLHNTTVDRVRALAMRHRRQHPKLGPAYGLARIGHHRNGLAPQHRRTQDKAGNARLDRLGTPRGNSPICADSCAPIGLK